jgi:class 3 adenylate cyclase/tetratricopeptide (TPR) repeat protein
MRSQIIVIGRDVALRARLARLVSRGGYRAEVAESVAHARRRGLKGIALGIVAADGLDAKEAIELRAALGEVLVVAETAGRAARDADLIDISDENRLLARIAEALASAAEPEAAESVLEFAGFRLDLVGHSLRDRKANEVPLTHGEFALLRALAERPGRVLSRNRLMELTAGPVAEAFDRSVDMQILRLRRKIEADPKRPSLIVTVPGSGYKLIAGAREATPVAAPTSERLADAAPRTAERRHVTALAAELVSPDGGGLPSDPEDLRAVIDEFRGSAAEALAHHGSAIGVARGLEIVAYFGDRQAQENDAERAVRAALAIQRALAEINAKNHGKGAPDLLARIGIETGPVVVEATGEVFGDAPNVAARVQAAAEPGSVLVTLNVQRQVAGLFVAEEQGARELRGLPEPVQLFRIVRASGGGRRGGARALTPFVGREEELSLLARRWERARAGEGQLVLIVGEPGLGKSRIVEEFRSQLTETPHTWSEWGASQLLQNTPLHPISEWGRQRFGVDDAPAEQRLADLENTLRLVGLDAAEHAPLLAPLVDIPLPPERAASFPPKELRRRQLASMSAWVLAGARSQPLVLAIEDLHWADPTSLDLLRALSERGSQASLLLLATTRPEFRPPWSLRAHHSVISLTPLDRAGVARMVSEISAHHALSKDVIESLSDRTGGVPLFVEEVTRLLLERGEQGGVQAIPPTLQQSLAARLDRLGAAREVAQIGAVLGRDFAYKLLRDVAELDEPVLQASLDRLAEADLLFVEGASPQASYRFKHALVQDAAYDSLLKTRRQALHRRAGELLRDDPERAAAEPEVIAHHFTQAGLVELSIEWWGRAGDQALRRSAFEEAIAHLGKAIAMADKSAAATSRQGAGDTAASSQRLKLQTDYGQAVMWSKGFAAEETKAAFARATDFAAKNSDFSERFAALHGEWTSALVRGELRSARELASTFLREAEEAERVMEAGVAHRGLALICVNLGEFFEARNHCERALEACDPQRDQEARERSGEDTWTFATWLLAITSWKLGDVERARELLETANRRATELGHDPTMASLLLGATWLAILRGDVRAALTAAEVLEDLSRNHGMAQFGGWAKMIAGWARGRLYDPAGGAIELRQALAVLADQGAMINAAFGYVLLAELEAETLGAESALLRIDDALTLAHQIEQRGQLALTHRLRGDILLKRDLADPSPAEEAYRTAIAIAKRQGARSYALLASLALAKLYQSTSRPAEAYAVLAPALEGFAPTPQMPEVAEAQALLKSLA